MEKRLLRIFFGIGLLLLPFAFKRVRLKDWLLVFFLKGYLSSFIGTVIVKNKNIKYPIRIFPEYFRISILFDYFLFPLLCVFYNRTSLRTKPILTFIQAFLYSVPITIIEFFLEKYTDLIEYRKSWNWLITYVTLTITFLIVRVFISATRRLNIEGEFRQS